MVERAEMEEAEEEEEGEAEKSRTRPRFWRNMARLNISSFCLASCSHMACVKGESTHSAVSGNCSDSFSFSPFIMFRFDFGRVCRSVGSGGSKTV